LTTAIWLHAIVKNVKHGTTDYRTKHDSTNKEEKVAMLACTPDVEGTHALVPLAEKRFTLVLSFSHNCSQKTSKVSITNSMFVPLA